jgi:hypothetical protein
MPGRDPFEELGGVPVRQGAPAPGDRYTQTSFFERMRDVFFANQRTETAPGLSNEDREKFLAGQSAGPTELTDAENFRQRILPAIGQGIAIGSAFLPGMAGLAGMPNLARAAKFAEPLLAAGGTALDPRATPTDIGLAGAVPAISRGFNAAAARPGARGFFGSIAPDQMRQQIRGEMAQRFGPRIASKQLFDEYVNPNMDLYVHPRKALESARITSLPEDLIIAGRRPKAIVADFQNSFGPGSGTMQSMGKLQDYFHQVGAAAEDAYDHGFKNYSQELFKFQKSIMDDMVEAVPQLKDARHAFLRENNITRLGKIMRQGKPLDEFDDFRKTGFFKAGNYTKQEVREMNDLTAMVARLGGGEHYFGKILGHGIFGTAMGAAMGGTAGAGVGFGLGAATGFMFPEIIGTAMSKAGGRALLRGLIKRNPAGWTPSALNAMYQWYQFDKRNANADPTFGSLGTEVR